MLCATGWILIVFFETMNANTIKVKVEQGTLIGVRESTLFEETFYYAFYGVPYAEPPIGHLRFKDPRKPKKYVDRYDATKEHRGMCAQAHIVHKHGMYGNENCLYLNIYTPSLPRYNKDGLKSVMVWIHGHAFLSSFSHLHGGDFFVENDVIVVSVTHRLGAFGFMDLDENDSDANMGLKDIVLALKWIRRNIGTFGGNKSQITIVGSDSGATYVSLLLTTNLGKLFSKVILQSGGLFSPSLFQTNPLEEREKLKMKVQNLTSKDLMSASAKDIIFGASKIYNSKEIINFQKPIIPFSPVIERHPNKSVLLENPYKKRWKNLKLNIPLMIGFNSQESIAEMIPFIQNPYYLKSFRSFFKYMIPFTDSCHYNYSSKIYAKVSNIIKSEYFPDGITEKSVSNFLRYVSDLIKYPIYKFIKTLTNVKSNRLFVYKFNYVGKFNAVKANSIAGSNIKIKGASKGDEICYLMRCDPLWERYNEIRNDSSNRDRKFIKEITEVWANFIKTGNPTPQPYFDNVTWYPMNKEEDIVFLFSSKSKLINSKSEYKMYKFWNRIYDDYYSGEHCKVNKHDEL